MSELNAEMVTEWARETLEEEFPGYTEYDAKTDEQYRIANLGKDRFRFERRGFPSRVFVIRPLVREET